MNNIFSLVYSDYNWQEHYFFKAPDNSTEEDFEKLCDSLLPKAGHRAAIKKSDPKMGGWICWGDVVEALVSLLEEQGYQRIFIDTKRISPHASNIIGIHGDPPDECLGFAGQIICNYNGKLERKMAEERKARRKLGSLKKRTVQIIK